MSLWGAIECEDQLPTSWESLWRHWLRSCWVGDMWRQAANNQYQLLDISQFGWKISNGELEIVNITYKKYKRVRVLSRRCSCKTGCTTRRCSCLKEGVKCGKSCRCNNCQNIVCAEPDQHAVQDEEFTEDDIVADYILSMLDGEEFGNDKMMMTVNTFSCKAKYTQQPLIAIWWG